MTNKFKFIALTLAISHMVSACKRDEKHGEESQTSGARSSPEMRTRLVRNGVLSGNRPNPAGNRNVALEGYIAQGRQLAAEAGGTLDDYPKLKRLIEDRLASLSTDEARAAVIMEVITTLPADRYLTKWQLTLDFINDASRRTRLLASAISDAAANNPSWAFEKLGSYEDPMVCEEAVQGVVKALLAKGDPLEVARAIKAELGDSDVFSLVLKQWLDSVKDIPNLSGAKGLVNELFFDSRVDVKVKENLAKLYVQTAGGDPPLVIASVLSQQGVRDGGWGQLVSDGAKLTGVEGNEFIGLVFNASPYQIGDFMKEYRKTHDATTILEEFESYPLIAQPTMLCSIVPDAFKNNAIPDMLARIEGWTLTDQNRVIERMLEYGASNNIPADQLQVVFDYGGGDPKRAKLYNYYLPKK